MKVVLLLLSIPLGCLLVAWLALIVVLAIIGDCASAAREADDSDYSQSDHYLYLLSRARLASDRVEL
jgi:hypothetical protein